jgi:hypothetical protein
VKDRAFTGESEVLERLGSSLKEPPGVVPFQSQAVDHIDLAFLLSSILETPKVLAKRSDTVA